jgi:hypothetical protein
MYKKGLMKNEDNHQSNIRETHLVPVCRVNGVQSLVLQREAAARQLYKDDICFRSRFISVTK